jgi:hypothetical protein
MFGGKEQLAHVGNAWISHIRQSRGNPRIPGDSRQRRATVMVPDTVVAQLQNLANAKRIPLW